MRTRRSSVRIVAAVWSLIVGCGVSPVRASAEPPPQLIIKFTDGISDPARPEFIESLSRDAGTKLVYLRPMSGGAHVFRVEGLANASLFDAVIRRLAARGDVVHVERDRLKAVAVSWSSESRVRIAAATSNRASVPADLLTKAHEFGAVRIIVQLRVPEGANEAAIETVKQVVRVEISQTPHQVVRELQGLPLLAIEASPETLRVLSASPHVLRVQEDVVERSHR